MQAVAEVMGCKGEITVGQEGANFFGEAVKNQCQSNAFLACEGAEVVGIGWWGRITVQVVVTVVDGCYEDKVVLPITAVCECELRDG